jgi:GTP-binding protein YchF
MKIGMIGLPNSGKTTVFNALTRSEKPVEAYSSGQVAVHTAVVEVPDPRVDVLSRLFQPEKTTYATTTFNDISGFGKGRGSTDIGGALLNAVALNDALMLVVRAFEDENVPHPEDSIDPVRDLQMVESELLLSDMTVIEKRLERLATQAKRGTPEEKKRMAAEVELLSRLMEELELERPLRDVELTEPERKLIGGYGFLSLKPLLRIVNGGDEDDPADHDYGFAGEDILFLRGQLEAEIAQMDAEESAEFLAEYGIDEPGLNRAIRMCYRMTGRETFFTVGEDEVRAWSMPAGSKAVEAAGIIHTDLERGFIRAETVSYADLLECGGLAAARKLGKLRLEGKQYVVQDGDVLAIRYNL